PQHHSLVRVEEGPRVLSDVRADLLDVRVNELADSFDRPRSAEREEGRVRLHPLVFIDGECVRKTENGRKSRSQAEHTIPESLDRAKRALDWGFLAVRP